MEIKLDSLVLNCFSMNADCNCGQIKVNQKAPFGIWNYGNCSLKRKSNYTHIGVAQLKCNQDISLLYDGFSHLV